MVIVIKWQFNSVAQSCPTLGDSMDCSTAGFPVHHQLLGACSTDVYRVSDTMQPSHPLSSPSLPALNLSQHQGLSQWVSSSHQVAKISEFQFQHQFSSVAQSCPTLQLHGLQYKWQNNIKLRFAWTQYSLFIISNHFERLWLLLIHMFYTIYMWLC